MSCLVYLFVFRCDAGGRLLQLPAPVCAAEVPVLRLRSYGSAGLRAGGASRQNVRVFPERRLGCESREKNEFPFELLKDTGGGLVKLQW